MKKLGAIAGIIVFDIFLGNIVIKQLSRIAEDGLAKDMAVLGLALAGIVGSIFAIRFVLRDD